MKDQQCIEFLQWALPKLHMRWRGFRKVRKQVCKRINRRMDELKLSSVKEYKKFLTENQEEWEILDNLCRITISRFYRNYKIFDKIGIEIFPELFQKKDKIRCWSAGCASGEEPYSISLIFFNLIQIISTLKEIEIIATDADQNMLERAKKGCYNSSTIKEIPIKWQKEGFIKKENRFCLKEEYKKTITFLKQDIRKEKPKGSFDLILCRNLVATYFDKKLQSQIFREITEKLNPNGYLILGKNEMTEALPEELEISNQHERIFRKTIIGESKS